MRSNIKTTDVKYFSDHYISTKFIKVLRNFQRKVCWSTKEKKEFIVSVFNGLATTPITLLDVSDVLQFHKRNNNEEESFFFRKHKDVGFISIDGQNRSAAIRSFMENEFSITGDIKNKDGKLESVQNVFYKDLSQRLKDAFHDTNLHLTIITESTKKEMHDYFLSINSGAPLNGQEKRNAFMTPMSEMIRLLAEDKEISKIWFYSKTLKEQKIANSFDAEWTAKFYMSLARGAHKQRTFSTKSLNSAGLDEFYGLGAKTKLAWLHQTHPEYSSEENARVREILVKVSRILEASPCHANTLSDRAMWALVTSVAWVGDQPGYEIQEGSLVDFYESVCRVDKSLVEKGDISFAKELTQWHKNGNQGPEPVASHYYRHKAGNMNDAKARMSRVSMLVKALLEDSQFTDAVLPQEPLRVSNG